jgi:Pyrimidine dimer DNA glycosylase
MRLWSLHPRYLDARGLVALWREALLAQAVLLNRTRGYRHHPQLTRFRDSGAPRQYICAYLREIHAEAVRRGYRFDAKKIVRARVCGPLVVSRGQLRHEWSHLERKLQRRAPAWLATIRGTKRPAPHPLFRVVRGKVAVWEIRRARAQPASRRRAR